jgi:hypothetical protein
MEKPLRGFSEPCSGILLEIGFPAQFPSQVETVKVFYSFGKFIFKILI